MGKNTHVGVSCSPFFPVCPVSSETSTNQAAVLMTIFVCCVQQSPSETIQYQQKASHKERRRSQRKVAQQRRWKPRIGEVNQSNVRVFLFCVCLLSIFRCHPPQSSAAWSSVDASVLSRYVCHPAAAPAPESESNEWTDEKKRNAESSQWTTISSGFTTIMARVLPLRSLTSTR